MWKKENYKRKRALWAHKADYNDLNPHYTEVP